jgi:hypothetical protein
MIQFKWLNEAWSQTFVGSQDVYYSKPKSELYGEFEIYSRPNYGPLNIMRFMGNKPQPNEQVTLGETNSCWLKVYDVTSTENLISQTLVDLDRIKIATGKDVPCEDAPRFLKGEMCRHCSQVHNREVRMGTKIEVTKVIPCVDLVGDFNCAEKDLCQLEIYVNYPEDINGSRRVDVKDYKNIDKKETECSQAQSLGADACTLCKSIRNPSLSSEKVRLRTYFNEKELLDVDCAPFKTQNCPP